MFDDVKILSEGLEKLENKIITVTSWQEDLRIACDIMNLPEIKERFKSVDVRIGEPSMGSLSGVLIMVNEIKDMTDSKFIIREFAKSEIHPKTKGKDKKIFEDYPEMKRRTWYLGENIILSLFLSWDQDTSCKYVKVGTKEEDVYELQCN